MNCRKDEDKGISLGATSSSGCIAPSAGRGIRAQSLEPESDFPKEGMGLIFLSL